LVPGAPSKTKQIGSILEDTPNVFACFMITFLKVLYITNAVLKLPLFIKSLKGIFEFILSSSAKTLVLNNASNINWGFLVYLITTSSISFTSLNPQAKVKGILIIAKIGLHISGVNIPSSSHVNVSYKTLKNCIKHSKIKDGASKNFLLVNKDKVLIESKIDFGTLYIDKKLNKTSTEEKVEKSKT
jgi:hypothetical protein